MGADRRHVFRLLSGSAPFRISSGAPAYKAKMIDPSAVAFALFVVIAVEFWWRARSRTRR
jgi:hypothetical protein